MTTFFAAIRLDPQTRQFEIRSPDFPDLSSQCDDMTRASAVADRALRARIRDEVATHGRVDAPTTRQELEGHEDFRQCFLIAVEVADEEITIG